MAKRRYNALCRGRRALEWKDGAPVLIDLCCGIENVAGAADFHGPPVARFGSRWLWGDVPALIPYPRLADRKKNIPGQRKNSSLLRARVPYELGAFMACVFGENNEITDSSGHR